MNAYIYVNESQKSCYTQIDKAIKNIKEIIIQIYDNITSLGEGEGCNREVITEGFKVTGNVLCAKLDGVYPGVCYSSLSYVVWHV